MKKKILIKTLVLSIFITGCKQYNNGYAPSQVLIAPSEASALVNSNISFIATGGHGPYTYKVIRGEASIAEQAGTFTAGSVVGEVVVRVTDDTGLYADAKVSVVKPALQISPEAIILSYGEQHTFTAAGGAPPYSFAIISGSGTMILNKTFIAGYSDDFVTVRATDNDGNYSDCNVQVTAPVGP
ncbi:MAG: hypothetical protein ACXVAX_08430 [Pseudobdellovibrio sp.]